MTVHFSLTPRRVWERADGVYVWESMDANA